MADLVTRMVVDNKEMLKAFAQLRNEIRKSKTTFGDFNLGLGSLGSGFQSVIGIATKFAGPISAGAIAVKTFQGVLNSQQGFSDAYARNMEAAKNATENFFYTLGKGNWSQFFNDFDTAIQKAKDYYDALDQLGNTQLSHNVKSAEIQATISEGQYLAKSKQAPVQERVKGFEQWKQGIDEQAAANETLMNELINVANTQVAKEFGTNVQYSYNDFVKAFSVDLMNPTEREKAKARAERGTNNYLVNAAKPDQYFSKEEKQALAEKQKENLLIYTMLQKWSDDELKANADKIISYGKTKTALNGLKREYNETINEFNNSQKNVKDFKPLETLQGFKWYDQSGVGKDNTTSGGKVKIKTEVEAPEGSIKAIQQRIADLKGKINVSTDFSEMFELQRMVEALEGQVHYINFITKYTEQGKPVDMPAMDSKPQGAPADMIPQPKLPDINAEGKIDWSFAEPPKKVIDKTKQLTEGLGAVGGVMGSIASMTNDSTSAMLSWGSGVVSAVGTAIPAIQKVVQAKTTEAGVTAVASAAETPIVGWLLAGAAVASVLAAIASLPKFADGGIVKSSLTTGDRNVIRVNGGEMILNNNQQSNLFSILDKGVSINGNAGGQVEFRIKGKELVGVLNNYNSKVNKVL